MRETMNYRVSAVCGIAVFLISLFLPSFAMAQSWQEVYNRAIPSAPNGWTWLDTLHFEATSIRAYCTGGNGRLGIAYGSTGNLWMVNCNGTYWQSPNGVIDGQLLVDSYGGYPSFTVVVEAYNLTTGNVGGTPVPTMAPPTSTLQPTSTIQPTATTMPTSSYPTGPGPDGTAGTGDDTCSGSYLDPCHVIVENFPTQQPYPTQIGAECGVEGKPACQVQDINTPIPTATMIPAVQTAIAAANQPIAPNAVPYSAAPNPTGIPTNLTEYLGYDVSGIVSMETSTYDFGCFINTKVYGDINVKLCLKYVWLQGASFGGFPLELSAVAAVAMVIGILTWIVRR